MSAALTLNAVGCVRGDRTLFSGLTLQLPRGQLLRVAGANGSGKTSLLRMVCGLLEPNVAHLMTEQREDLKLMATRYHAMLVKRQKTIPQEEDDKYNPRAV
ncbi:MAG: ATP-binding cassette domain-containing protein, partial [Hydrogenophaga sp.]